MPGVFTSEEERGSPVRVRDRAFENDVKGCMLRLLHLLRKQDIDVVLGSGESRAR